MKRTTYNTMALTQRSNGAKSLVALKQLSVATAIVTDSVDDEGRIQLPVIASTITKVFADLDKKLFTEDYLAKIATSIKLLALLPDGSKAVIAIDLYKQYSLVDRLMHDAGIDTKYRTDDYGNTTLDMTDRTKEDYKLINELVSQALTTIGQEITDGKYYLQMSRSYQSKHKLSVVYK